MIFFYFAQFFSLSFNGLKFIFKLDTSLFCFRGLLSKVSKVSKVSKASKQAFWQSYRPGQDARVALIDLQYFAESSLPEDKQSKTEDPTEKKIEKAREQGRVAKSTDLVTVMVVLFPIGFIFLMGGFFYQNLMQLMYHYFSSVGQWNHSFSKALIESSFAYLFILIIPIASIAFGVALLTNLIQVGFLLTFKPLVPDFSKVRLDFSRFLKKSFFSMEGLYNLAKSLFKIALMVMITYIVVRYEMGAYVAKTLHQSLAGSIGYFLNMAYMIIFLSCFILFVLGLVDYLFQRWLFKENLKMSKQEIKQERKEAEGDPQVKARLRQRMQQLLQSHMMEDLKEADVVIVNPTHYAVALKWAAKEMIAPMVVAKGIDYLALRIKTLAKEHEIAVVENKILARSLYAAIDIGQVIKPEYWEIVSRILAQVYQMEQRSLDG